MDHHLNAYEISGLIAAYLSHTLTPGKQQLLEEWLQQSEANRELFRKICLPENLEQRNTFIRELPVDHSWQKVHRQLLRASRRRIRQYSRIAAILLLLLSPALWLLKRADTEVSPFPLSGTFPSQEHRKALLITPEGNQIALSTANRTRQSIFLDQGRIALNNGRQICFPSDTLPASPAKGWNIIRVPRGGEYELILPDRTHVWLNSESELRFPTSFSGEKRKVELLGEAYFSVTRDTARPFLIETDGSVSIEVLGTRFNVQAYPGDQQIETTLSQGAVKVSDGKNAVVLKPDQQAVYQKQTASLLTREVRAEDYSAWKDGKFIFHNETLEYILNKLSRWYDLQVTYKNEEVKQYHFSGDLERYADFTQALHMIEKATDLRFSIRQNQIIVSTR